MAITIGSTTSNNAGTLSASGIGSGLDVNGIVTALMAVENKALAALDTRHASFESRISAYGTVKSAMSRFQSALSALTKASTFSSLAAKSSDTATFTASIAGLAVAGTYSIKVTALAQAQKLASSGFTSTSDVVGTGVLTFDTGAFAAGVFTSNGNGAKSVTIASGNQTLSGIRDAVNAANIGVSATIVNDGSAAGNRLVFTSLATGAAQSLKISVGDSDGNDVDAAGLSRLAFDPAALAGSGRNLVQTVAAQDAQLTIDGIDVRKPSNVITDAIEGVTLNLLATNATAATMSIAADGSDAAKSVQAFVTAYNALNTTLRSLTKFDPVTKQGSPLTGDSAVRSIQARMSAIIGDGVPGLQGSGSVLSTLGQAGISLGADGALVLDNAKLTVASAGNIAALFAAVGKASDSLIAVAASSAATKPGTYAVTISQLATRATSTGSAAAGLAIVAGVNDALAVTLDGNTVNVTLAAGNYASADALAAEVQAKINGSAVFATAGSRVAVANQGGVLAATSARYGSGSNITWAGSAATTLFGAAPVSVAGSDVAGTIGGIAANGAGQNLRAALGSAAEGLALSITAGGLGARGDIVFSRGYASLLDAALGEMLGRDGVVATRSDGMTRSMADLDGRRSALTRRLATVEAHYRAQFTALDTMLGRMSTTSSYLTQQLASLPKING